MPHKYTKLSTANRPEVVTISTTPELQQIHSTA